MRRIKKETFYDDLIYIMGQGNSEKMDYIRKRLSVIPWSQSIFWIPLL